MNGNAISIERGILLSITLCAGAGATQVSGADPTPVVEWLRDRAHAIDSVRPEADSRDLVALGDLVGNARVVLLGEEVHGVREFTLLKHRIVRYLVEHRGFRTIALEQDTIGCERIDRYVRDGQGDAASVLQRTYWCWNNPEMRGLLRWLREHNEEAEQPVRFVGIDNQSVRGAAGRLRGAVPPGVDLDAALEPFAKGRSAYQKLRTRDKKRHRRAIADLDVALAKSPEPVRAAARILGEVRELWAARNARERMNARDRHMAERTRELLRSEDARVIVWAHNAHVSRAVFYGGVVPLGKLLSKDTKTAVVGFYFGAGEYLLDPRARRERRTRTLAQPPGGSFGDLLSRVGKPLWMADVRGELPARVRALLSKPPAGHFDNYAAPPSLVGAVDVLVYVDRVTPPASK